VARVKITVVERSFRKEYVDKYVEEERRKTIGRCEMHTDGEVFVTDAVQGMPKGFCPWAWNDIYKVVVAYVADGDFSMWNQGGNKILACCSDGTRPVYFEIERLDE
jgi:uncharacterized repeat protein (TIGR04076 family)